MAAIPTKDEYRAALVARHGETLARKFDCASVAVCGLGGLGSNIAYALARAGVGHLHLIDFDVVDITNLNRQQYAAAQIGQKKTDALRANLLAAAPYCNIKTDCVRITEENLVSILKDDQIICEAFDCADSKAMLTDGVFNNFPDKYLVSGSGMAGMFPANMIKTRRITDKFYLCGDGVSDASDGLELISARVLVCAAHEAHAVLRIIAGEYDV